MKFGEGDLSIKGLSVADFRSRLRSNLTSAQAISDPSHLRGRQAKLDQIDRAFNSPGKHVFIYGDRGVGKTSLALSAAVLHQSADNDPIFVSCDQSLTCFRLVTDIVKGCIPARDVIQRRKVNRGVKFSLFGLGGDLAESIERGTVPDIASINEAVNCLRYVAQFHSREPVVIVDEFDQLTNVLERKHFADLIKQLSDRDVGIRLIMTGIGRSLDDLIALLQEDAHEHLPDDRWIHLVPSELPNHPLFFHAHLPLRWCCTAHEQSVSIVGSSRSVRRRSS